MALGTLCLKALIPTTADGLCKGAKRDKSLICCKTVSSIIVALSNKSAP
jgi:hypothetical protein